MSTPEKRPPLGNNEPTPKKAKLTTDYVCNALDCIVFRLVDHDPTLPPAAAEFKAEFAHQVFGESEEISGYTGLHIGINISAATAHTWVDAQWTQKRYICDDLDAVVGDAFSSDCVRSQQEFKQLLSTPVPDYRALGGETVNERLLEDGSEAVVQLFNLSTAPKEIQELHARLEPLLLFFMDGSSEIDPEDPKWELMLATQKTGGKTRVVGFSTLYNYFHYPEGVRPRLSQVFVLPPYQGKGLGTLLVQTAYQLARQRGAPDLTVEDPSPELQTMRQRLELKALKALSWFCEEAEKLVAAALKASGRGKETANGGNNSDGADVSGLQLPKEVLKRIQEEEKIHSAEARQVWEAYLWQHPKLQSAKGRDLTLGLIKQRLHSLHFSTVEKNAVGKTIRDLAQDGSVFDMMKRAQTGQTAEGAEASNGPSSGGAVSVGKRNICQVNQEDMELVMQQLVGERGQELDRVTKKKI